MKKVVCINDRKLPEGAEVVNGREYRVINEFINSYEQKVFIISGIRNKGTTKKGLMWHGYSSSRFTDLNLISIGNVEYSEELSN